MRRAGALLLISLDDVEEQLCVVEARDPGVDKNERERAGMRENGLRYFLLLVGVRISREPHEFFTRANMLKNSLLCH
jgi:hypothetical protein